jgi:glycosyltransferase involved in cell wall biosynthesis
LKILFFSNNFYPDIGGIESISEMLATAFVQQGAEVHLLTWTQGKEEKEFPFKVIRTPSISVLLKEFIWADVVFENNPCLRMSWPNLFMGKPIVTGLQTWLSPGNQTGIPDKVKQRWLRKADKVIACSEAVRNVVFKDAIVIGNPYNETIFSVHPEVVKTKDFIFLGRLVSDKGAGIAIEAFRTFLEKGNSDSTLTIVGDGSEKAALENLVKQYSLGDKIVFTGSMRGEALVKCLNGHNYLLVPSVWKEPFGIVALEGLACGCIPIVSDGGGLPDAVGKAGLVFKRGDAAALAAQMIALKNSSEMQEGLRKAAAAHLIAHQSKNVADKYLAVIKSVLHKQAI